MGKQAVSTICRDYGYNSQEVFKLLIEQNLLYRERINGKPYNLLTDKGRFFGGEYHYNDSDEKWSIWDEDFIVKFITGINTFEDMFMSVDHMTHINNLESILEHGLLAHGNGYQKEDISNQAVNSRREQLEPINKKPIHSYVPFYYNTRNAMLYHNREIQEEIVVLGFHPNILLHKDAIYTDGNAARSDTDFYNDITEYFGDFDKDKVFSVWWTGDEHIKSTMMSELLIPNKVDLSHLEYIFCYSERMAKYLSNNFDLCDIKIHVSKKMYF